MLVRLAIKAEAAAKPHKTGGGPTDKEVEPLCTDGTAEQPDSGPTPPEPWQSPRALVRYVIYRLAQATPAALLIWETYLRR